MLDHLCSQHYIPYVLRVSTLIEMERTKEIIHLTIYLFFLKQSGLLKDHSTYYTFFFLKAQHKVISFVLFCIATPSYKF